MIHEDMKAVQFIEIPIYCSDIEITDEKNLYSDTTSRGDKGFGSHDNI
jgi:dUTPase